MNKQKRHLKKRIMSILLSMAMVLGCITVSEKKVYAATELSDGAAITADITEDTIITGDVTLSGDLWLKEGVTLTISEGATLTISMGSFLRPDGNINGKGVISGDGRIVIYDGSISDCTVYTYITNTGIIAGGTFHGGINNSVCGTIRGGTFYGTVTNTRGSTISGGEFYGTVNNTYDYEDSTISGGTFHSTVTNNGTTIIGGTFNAGIENNGTIAFSDAGNLSISGEVTGSGTITVNGETHVHNTEGGTTYTDITETQHTKNVSCKDCAVKHVEITTEEHSTTVADDKEATCTKGAYCSVCESYYGDVNSDNHTLVYSINGAIISVECSGCDAEGSITIAAPAGDELVYTGNAYEAGYDTPTGLLASETPTITYTGDNLVEGKPVNAGTYIANITVGDKTASVEYTIKPAELTVSGVVATVTLSSASYTYDGSEKQPTVTVTLDGKTLVKDTDYTVTYGNNTNAGTATVTITGKGNYAGTVTKTFTINAATINNAKVSLSESTYYYNGKAKKPAVTVKLGNKTLKKDTDYTVKYAKNTNIGTATVTIEGKDNYTGSVKKNFKITVKKGASYTVDKYKYKISSTSAVAFAGLKSTKTTKVTIPKTVKIGGKTFKVTSVANKALYKKTKVTSVSIGSNVTKIGTSAFEGCTKLSKVTIGSKVTKIGDKAFKCCKTLKSVTVPGKVTTIGKEAFRNCSKLSTITIKSTKLKTVGKNAFKGIKSTAKIKVPSNKLKAYKTLLKGKGQGGKVKIVKY